MLNMGLFGVSNDVDVTLMKVNKRIEGYLPVVSYVPLRSTANASPYRPQELLLNATDQRNWEYMRFIMQSPVLGTTGDMIVYDSTYYKIMSVTNWNRKGYMQYDTIQTFYDSPNTTGEVIKDEVAVGICSIITEWFSEIGKVLLSDQLFIYNANYTVAPTKSFYIVVQFIEAKTTGWASETHLMDGNLRTTYETPLECVYNIHIFSCDGSAYNITDTVRKALQSHLTTEIEREKCFSLSQFPTTFNDSQVVGGTYITRETIRLQVNTITSQLSGVRQAMSSMNFELFTNL